MLMWIIVVGALLFLVLEGLTLHSWWHLKNKKKDAGILYLAHLSPFIAICAIYIIVTLIPSAASPIESFISFLLPGLGNIIALIYTMPMYMLAFDSQRLFERELRAEKMMTGSSR